MRCEEARNVLATRRELPYAQERALQDHLGTCAACRAVSQREERAVQALRQVAPGSASPSAATTRAIRARLAGTLGPSKTRPLWTGSVVLVAVALLWLGLNSGLIHVTLGRVGLLPQMPVADETTAGPTLYIASFVPLASDPQSVQGRVTALDLETGRERYRVEGADELALAPNGGTLFVAGRFPDDPSGDDAIRALDPRSGNERWRTPIAFRAAYPGQQNLLVSPDGRWLYVRSYDVSRGSGDAATVPFWLQVVDARSGQVQPTTIELPGISECGAPHLVSPPTGNYAYLACYWGNILVLNTATQRLENHLPADMSGAVVLPSAEDLWVVSARPWVVSEGVEAGAQLHELALADLRVLQSIPLRVTQPFAATNRPVTWVGSEGRLVGAQVLEETQGTDTATALLVFDAASGQEEGRFRYERPLGSLAIDPSGQVLYAAINFGVQRDTTIVGLNLPDGMERATFPRPGEQVYQLLIGP